METKNALKPMVKSPSKDAHLKAGKGFSLSEIEASGHSISVIKKLKIKIDYFRNSSHEDNISLLKSINIPASKDKREPFVQKEKKRTPFKPEIKKIKKKPTSAPKKSETKSKVIKEEKPQKEIKKQETKLKPIETDATPLVKLSGLGPARAAKFNEIGVNCVEDLLKENPQELASLIKGCSEEKIIKWIEEGKNLILKKV
jgi:predicted flap endonuclease-1-like 5' DNA nuclease